MPTLVELTSSVTSCSELSSRVPALALTPRPSFFDLLRDELRARHSRFKIEMCAAPSSANVNARERAAPAAAQNRDVLAANADPLFFQAFHRRPAIAGVPIFCRRRETATGSQRPSRLRWDAIRRTAIAPLPCGESSPSGPENPSDCAPRTALSKLSGATRNARLTKSAPMAR
jgi:hypothetical protein